MPKKILFLSDSVSASSGLARITRDLALRVHQNLPEFEVATIGYGGHGSAAIPFKEYFLNSVKDWLPLELPDIWNDFVGDEEGILFSIWDASRLYWLGIPKICPVPFLRRWVETAKVKKWIYGAIDAEGPNGRLSHQIAETYQGFDRVLDYSAFSSRITGNPEHLPHGIDSGVFYPRGHTEARANLIGSGFRDLTPDSLLVGIVATNQARKNWQLGFETCKILLDRGYDVRLWCHTDQPEKYWSLTNLTADYGMVGRVAVTTQRFGDEQLAMLYSACNVSLGIAPEGFGYPIAESLACGTPVVVGSYGAQAEFVPKHMQVDPADYYYEGAYCSKRPVHYAGDWACWVESTERVASLPPQIDWNGPTLWPKWAEWFRRGL